MKRFQILIGGSARAYANAKELVVRENSFVLLAENGDVVAAVSADSGTAVVIFEEPK
jgi:hypothetical protein